MDHQVDRIELVGGKRQVRRLFAGPLHHRILWIEGDFVPVEPFERSFDRRQVGGGGEMGAEP
jgi:hypothetical protein